MKRILLAVVLFILIKPSNAQVQFDALKITPQFPKVSQTVSFKFIATLSPLIDAKKVDIVVYLFDKNNYKVVEPKIMQNGKNFSGEFKTEEHTDCIAFSFLSGKEKDNNRGKGFIIPVYTNNNTPVVGYYNVANNLQNGFGEYMFEMSNDADKGLAYLEDGYKQYPELKKDPGYFNSYLEAINAAKKKAATEVILKELQQFENNNTLNEAGYNTLIQWYGRNKKKGKADSLKTAMQAAFPEGNWKKDEAINAITKSKDSADVKEALFETFIKNYPPKEEDKSSIDYLKSNIASAYQKEKNYFAFKRLANELPMASKAMLYNNLSWAMAEAKEDIAEAKAMSNEATQWTKKEMDNPTEKKPEYITKKGWADQRNGNYAMFADTYAFILYQTGEYKQGLPYAKDAAKSLEFKNADYDERYSMLLEKTAAPAVAKKEIEQFTRDGAASPVTKEILKRLYVAEKKSDNGYQAYITELEAAAKIKRRAELAKTMLNEASPKFTLEDLDGNAVSLESLKGKVVIVDFWATWCGPCIASMPGMKTVQEKLKERNDVAFIFVDTWQTEDNKKQNAIDFMKKNNYPFHVLLDNENKVVADFKVSGIPTKFIIDKTGNIRFKSVGFGGNADALVDEVGMMVDMASSDAPAARKYVK